MSYNSSSSSLLDRLRAHAKWQEQKRIATNALLNSSNSATQKCPNIENDRIIDSSELDLTSQEFIFFKSLNHESVSKEIDYKNVSLIDKSGIRCEDIVSSNYVAPLIENSNEKVSCEIDENNVEKESVAKFNYLKKGQGLKRFNSKKLIGFHKGTSTKNIYGQPIKELKFKSDLLSKKNWTLSEQTNNRKKGTEVSKTLYKSIKNNESPIEAKPGTFDAFEILEELVGHESFISTSSRVNYLFQEDCSTPVPLCKSSFEGLDLTPITQPNNNGISTLAMSKHAFGHLHTPVRNLFSSHEQQSIDFSKNIQRCPNHAKINAQISQQSSWGAEKYPVDCNKEYSKGHYQTGILKKHWPLPNESNSLSKSSNLVPKVHFPDNGAKILEYDQHPDETISETICSEDTDLVNTSDLENLKFLGLNYNFEIVHEVSSSSDKKNEANNQVFKKTSMNLKKCHIYESPKFLQKQLSNSPQKQPMVSKLKDLSLSFKPKEKLHLCDSYFQEERCNTNIQPSEMVLKSNVESDKLNQLKHNNSDNDIKANKLLLLSKVYDLKKEIKIFKCKNKRMDKLITELEDEKKNLIRSHEKEQQQKINIIKYGSNNNRKKMKPVPFSNELDKKIHKLNERICNLNTENLLLKRKVVFLEKKENELMKKPNKLITTDNKMMEQTKKFAISNKISSAAKENTKDSCLDTNEEMVPKQQLQVETVENLSLKAIETKQEKYLKEIMTSEMLKSDSKNVYDVFKSTYLDASTPTITIQENTNAKLSTKHYPNGDIQINYPDKVVYFYCKEKISHTRFKEGKEIIEFETGQKEIYFHDGSHQIICPDKSCISVYGDGTQKIVSTDGTSTHIKTDGTKTIEFPNGQKEIYQNNTIERIYPDGTVKILYVDGMQETRYKNGQIRVKTKEGQIIMK